MGSNISSEIKFFSQDPQLCLIFLMPFENEVLGYRLRKFLLIAHYSG